MFITKLDQEINEYIRDSIDTFEIPGLMEFILSKIKFNSPSIKDNIERRIRDRIIQSKDVIMLQFQDLGHWTLYDIEEEMKQK